MSKRGETGSLPSKGSYSASVILWTLDPLSAKHSAEHCGPTWSESSRTPKAYQAGVASLRGVGRLGYDGTMIGLISIDLSPTSQQSPNKLKEAMA